VSSGHDFFSDRPLYAVDIRTHYDVLGVSRTATAAQVREAYRSLARIHHPDHAPGVDVGGPVSASEMASINEAYRVLSDAARRVQYDRSLRESVVGSAVPPSTRSRTTTDDDEIYPSPPVSRWNPLDSPGPAKVPWRLMIGLTVLGSALVLVTAAFTDPPSIEPPDGILQVGSCVAVEANFDVREVACLPDGPDLVVRRVLPVGSTCPPAFATHRDRLGLSTVCVVAEA
jgi:molecular chaperone DnaJ